MTVRERRSLRYIRLAAWFAGLPPEVEQVDLTVDDVERLIEDNLPAAARFPSWWRNDGRRAHARAWLLAGWSVAAYDPLSGRISFERRTPPATS